MMMMVHRLNVGHISDNTGVMQQQCPQSFCYQVTAYDIRYLSATIVRQWQ